MKRREFITLLGGAAAWPGSAFAQPSGRTRRIGWLSRVANDSESKARSADFREELQRLAWIDGQNVRIDGRFGEGDAARISKYVAELNALSPDVILSTGGTGTELLLFVSFFVASAIKIGTYWLLEQETTRQARHLSRIESRPA